MKTKANKSTHTQLEMLLTQFHNCSLQISQMISTGDIEELADVIAVKDGLLEKIEQIKNTSEDKEIVADNDLIVKIRAQELSNLEAIKTLREATHCEFRTQSKNSKLLKAYEPQRKNSGSILDMIE